MTAQAALHSRAIAAGYDPGRLRQAKVLVVGLGALGQNVVQNLALVGTGRLTLVDFDRFETHNATRSPFYPTPAEAARLGLAKAPLVALRAAGGSTAEDGEICYADSLIQQLGDGAVAWSDVVVAAVDNMNARAWLAERCRLLGRPLVEGGFAGPDFNLAVFGADDGAPCYRCSRPGRESAVSCTAYALAAEQQRIIPAIQTTAAVLGGYLAEQVARLLHGDTGRTGYRSYGSVRRETLHLARLSTNPECPGIHDRAPVIGTISALGPRGTVANLLDAVARQWGPGQLRFAEQVIAVANCTACRESCLVQSIASAWLAHPRCTRCGGPWPLTEPRLPDGGLAVRTDDTLTPQLADTPLASLGVRPGATLAVTLDDRRAGLLRIDGDALDGCTRVPLEQPRAGLAGLSLPPWLGDGYQPGCRVMVTSPDE